MSFLPAAKAYAATLAPGSSRAIIMDYLINNAVGSSNAAPWSAIQAHLLSHGIRIAQNTFQQGLLADSRTLDCFIGSHDKGKKTRGYFIIDSIFDAELMRDWYMQRMGKEQFHLDNLKLAALKAGWNI